MAEPFRGTINVDIRDSKPDWAPFEPPKAPDGAPNVLYIVLDDVGFSALELVRRADPDAEHRPDRRERRPLHAVPHDGALLADPLLPPDRAQPHPQQHGLHHRGRDRLPERERHDPARERDAVRDPRRAGLEHLHGRQVASLPDRRDEPRLDAAQLADRARLRALVRVPRRRDEPVVPRPRLRQPSGRPAEHSRRGLPPHRRHHRQGARVHPRREGGRAGEAVLPLLRARAPATRHTTRRRSGSTSSRASSTWATRRSASRRSQRQKKLGIVPADTELPPVNPIGDQTRTGPDGKPFPMLDVTRPWDSLNDEREEALLPHGRGVRRVPRRTPTTTSGACSTTSRRTTCSRTR